MNISRIVGSLALLSILSWSGTAAATDDASFTDVLVTSDGRVQVGVRFGARYLREVSGVELSDDGIDIYLEPFGIPTPPESHDEFMTFVLDNVPPGTWMLRLNPQPGGQGVPDDEAEITISEPRRLRLPFPATRFWPPDATVLDKIWLLIEPVDFCSEVILAPVGLELEELPGTCSDDEAEPVMAAIPLPGSWSAGIHSLTPLYWYDENKNRIPMTLTIGERIPSRVAGAWYDRAQSGHGISLQVLDDETMLVFWYTFDDDGNPAWILAQGAHEGLDAVLPAHVALGGRFPPHFDPDDIERLDWGELRIEFHSCDRATMRWSTDFPGFSSGEMPLVRLSRTAGHSCTGPPPPSALVPDWYQGPGTYFRLSD